MKHLRPALCVVLVASLAAGGVATAASKPKPKPRPVCNLVVDPAGDASLQPPVPSDAGLDILSADLASNAKVITAVLRMKSVGTDSASSVTGRRLSLQWSAPGGEFPLYLSMSTSQAGTYFDYGYLDTSATPANIESQGVAKGRIDAARNAIYISAPVSVFKPYGKVAPGAKLTTLEASGAQIFGVPQNDTDVYTYLSGSIDTATSAKAYVAGYPSCVTPGK